MTNEEQKLREIEDILADIFTAGGESHEVGGQSFDQLKQSGYIDRKISDLTALISEHYYPKAFVEWLLVNAEIVEYKGVNMWKVYLAGFMSHPYFTTDELYKIRKENER